MKLALLYTFWTGDNLSMLKDSINKHRHHVDEIIVNVQSISNKGENFYSDTSEWEKFLGCKIIYFKPNLKLNTKQNERIKHNELIEVAKHMNCTHFILAAADHFYPDHVIEYGKKVMNEESPDVILTRMRTFYKHANWYLNPIEEYYMPFIHKLNVNTEITTRVKYPVNVDPSVKVNTSKKFHISSDEYLMDHLSMVRTDIRKKFRNAAASMRWTKEDIETFVKEYDLAKVGDSIKYFQGRKIVEFE